MPVEGELNLAQRAGRDELEVLAIADLDHELIGVGEEELVDGRPAHVVVHRPLRVLYTHLSFSLCSTAPCPHTNNMMSD